MLGKNLHHEGPQNHLHGFISPYLARGNKSGYGIFATADRIVGVRSRRARALFLLGIQVGTEGYGSVLSVDFSDMTIGTHMPDAAAADTNFDHIINSLDTADEANSFGKCPNNHSTSPQAYKWTVDVAADSCNNILDSAYIAYYYGLSY